jgi:hypothetical protein
MEADSLDLDAAMRDLRRLFARARREGVLPHLLDRALFHEAWSVLNTQPFRVRDRYHAELMDGRRAFLLAGLSRTVGKRYENARTA